VRSRHCKYCNDGLSLIEDWFFGCCVRCDTARSLRQEEKEEKMIEERMEKYFS